MKRALEVSVSTWRNWHLRTRWHEWQATRRMNLMDQMRCAWWRSLASIPPARVIHAESDGRERMQFVFRVLRPFAKRWREHGTASGANEVGDWMWGSRHPD